MRDIEKAAKAELAKLSVELRDVSATMKNMAEAEKAAVDAYRQKLADIAKNLQEGWDQYRLTSAHIQAEQDLLQIKWSRKALKWDRFMLWFAWFVVFATALVFIYHMANDNWLGAGIQYLLCSYYLVFVIPRARQGKRRHTEQLKTTLKRLNRDPLGRLRPNELERGDT